LGASLGPTLEITLGNVRQIDLKIRPAGTLIWSWESVKSNLNTNLSLGLTLGATFLATAGRWLASQVSGLFIPLGLALIFTLIGGFSEKHLTKHDTPSLNEGIHRSLKTGLLKGLGGGLGSGLFFGLFFGVLYGLGFGLAFGFCFGLAWLVPGLRSAGLDAALRHYTLRFWLGSTHTFPFNAVPFLEDATARILLRRVGDGYSFTHRLLLDYFADLQTTSPAPSSSAHRVQPPPAP
jgi:hypothetical protein